MSHSSSFALITLLAAASVLSSCGNGPSGTKAADNGDALTLTRGIGVYPGNPGEYFGPTAVADKESSGYRNLALHREVHHSSSYDYNLTGHLITDGIIAESRPYYIDVVSQNGSIEKRSRERIFDDNTTAVTIEGGEDAFLRIDLHNRAITVDDASRIDLSGTLECDLNNDIGYAIIVEGSDNGKDWYTFKEFRGKDLPGKQRWGEAPGGGSQDVTVAAGLGLATTQVTEQMQAVRRAISSRTFAYSIPIPKSIAKDKEFSSIRIRLQSKVVREWSFQEINFINEKNIPKGKDAIKVADTIGEGARPSADTHKEPGEISLLPCYDFVSAWMPQERENQWVSVNLGEKSTFDKIVLHWIEKPLPGGTIEVSDDGKAWNKIADLASATSTVEAVSPSAAKENSSGELFTSSKETFEIKGEGRFVRIGGLSSSEGNSIILSEMEVYGNGGVDIVPSPQPKANGNRLYLSGGNWRLQKAGEVVSGEGKVVPGEEISKEGFLKGNEGNWIVATVPATVASSYFNIGAIPDQRYDDDQLQISESFFMDDFWYRDEFTIPEEFRGKELTLNFDGINWKADVFLNGASLGRIDGAFIRGRFDITDKVRPGTNTLAVKIHKNDNPGIIKEQTRITADVNGGVLGGDNPTMHCTVGWDWIPTVRGRNIGIWNDVWIGAYDGGVSIDDVFIDTDIPLPSTEYATLSPTVTLTNHSAEDKTANITILYGKENKDGNYGEGAVEMTGSALIKANSTMDIALSPTRIEHPNLWWPNGYGDPYLYDVKVAASIDGKISDAKSLKSGIREMSYTTNGGILDMYVNGRRLIGNGGNWGFPEIGLNYRAREYETAVAYHADMGYTMIRDWVGQTGDEEFYEACDRHGITVWQDFWLANPYDGPDPQNNSMFLANAEDYVRKIRNHPSIALYCGRNEGYPPKLLDEGLRNIVSTLHPGLYYIPHSATDMVSGNGPYRALPVEDYFSAERGKDRFHSERGMPNVMTYESIQLMLREENQWPQTSVWGIHDYTLENAQSCQTFNEMIEKAFGEPKDLKQFSQYAQWINYNGYRAMYESRSWNRKGLLIWMSHSCWPSMVWQTYDYFFEPTAAYFGVKKGSAPIRIQFNPISKNIEVVNNNAGMQTGLTAIVQILGHDGSAVFEERETLDSREDTTTPILEGKFDIENILKNAEGKITEVYFIKLKLEKEGRTVADNFYWESTDEGNFKQLLTLPKVKLGLKSTLAKEDGIYRMSVKVKNTGKTPALMIRLKAQGKNTGERILPAIYEDNYFSLMGGEEKEITITMKEEDCRGEVPVLEVEGFNIK